MALLYMLAVTYAWVSFFKKKPILKLDLSFWTLFFLVFYVVFFVSAYPLILLESWSVSKQAFIAAVFSFYPIFHFIKLKKFQLPKLILNWKLSLILIAGIGFQWKSIFYFYSTHDPSIYLAQSIHIAKTGTFFHRNNLNKNILDSGDKSPLKEAYGFHRSEWSSLDNFGLHPVATDNGRSNFHGYFGAPLFFAIAVSYLGEEHATKANFIHFLAIGTFLLFLFQYFYKKKSLLSLSPLLLFAICPLIPLVFRMTLSEPLATAVFLGMVICSLRSKTLKYRIILVGLLLASISTRISAVLYIPFVFVLLSLYCSRWEKKLVPILTLAIMALVFYVSPRYSLGIFRDHLEQRLKIPLSNTFIYSLWGTFLLVNTGLLFWGKKLYTLSSPYRRRIVIGFTGFWVIGVLIRYWRLLTKLDYNIGGIPFVNFNFDSWIFYGCPLITLLGIAYWLYQTSHHSRKKLFFIQSYFAFALFFYTVFLFGPNQLQVFNQRYLTIELIPFSILGCCLLLNKFNRNGKVAFFSFSIFWLLGLTISLNKPEICEHSYQDFLQLRKIVNNVDSKKVLLVRNLKWLELTHVVPLFTIDNIPILFVNEKNQENVRQATIKMGWKPVLVSSVSLATDSTAFSQCHEYSPLFLAAPPLNLEKYCVTLFFTPLESKQSALASLHY